GCYGGYLPPGVWTSFGQDLRRPVGPIHWAGAEAATVWSGYMGGAISSGGRAALEGVAGAGGGSGGLMDLLGEGKSWGERGLARRDRLKRTSSSGAVWASPRSCSRSSRRRRRSPSSSQSYLWASPSGSAVACQACSSSAAPCWRSSRSVTRR